MLRAFFAVLIVISIEASAAAQSTRSSSLNQPDAHAAPVPNRLPLQATPFIHLPLGAVRPEGWLKQQLALQKTGLTGSAEQLYDALTKDSGWLGGAGEGWEKSPYYVRGLIALAYTLDDDELKQRAQKWIDWALQSQRPDGSFGPTSNDDWWPRMIVLYYLRDHYEATGDSRVLPFLLKYFKYQNAELPKRRLRDWGRARAGDNLDIALWTYNLTGEAWLLDLARLLHSQAYPWASIFTNNRFYGFAADYQPHHIVNVCEALKFPAVSFQLLGDDQDRGAFKAGIEHLNRQFGRIDGQFSGTEQLSGRRSTDGVELCADIERIISNGVAVQTFGDANIADQLEKVAYNSLPAHTTADLRQITYYQLPNQVACTDQSHGFTQDYHNGIMPGPYSGFPCCCYNWHTGWPKLVQNLWAATEDNGLAAIAYGPSRVMTAVAGNVPITITETTEYPFDGKIVLTVEPKTAATFPLVVRIPGWCDSPSVKVNGESLNELHAGTFRTIKREWKANDRVELNFPMEVRTSTWTNDSVGLERGPLAFGLKIQSDWNTAKEHAQGKFDEFEIRPASAWNYALQIDRHQPAVNVHTQPVSAIPWDFKSPPVVLSVRARRVPAWGTRAMPGTIELGKADHNYSAIADSALPLEPGVPHHLRVEVKGTLLRLFVDDMNRPVIDKEDDTYSTGRVGLRTFGAAATFTDVKLNGTALVDSWQFVSGTWNVGDGKMSVDAARDGKAIFTKSASLRDFTFEAIVTPSPGGNAGLIFRASDVTEDLDGYRGYYIGLSARKLQSADAQEPPTSPVISDQPLETVELIPFGSTKIRIAYFPTLSE